MKLIQYILLATVFSTGSAILIMEVAAVRVLAPYFGASLYVLSSVLTVILLALSLGYYCGGKLSDRFPKYAFLYTTISIGGLLLLILTFLISEFLPTLSGNTPLLFGPLLLSVVFFFTPAFILGVDSPFVIKLLSKDVTEEKRGNLVGATFFWSTTGSIAGSLIAGFYLIPTFGLKETLYGTSIFLVLLSFFSLNAINFLLKKYNPNEYKDIKKTLLNTALIPIITFLIFVFIQTKNSEPTTNSLLYDEEGLYSHIQIFETRSIFSEDTIRYLKRDTNFSSAIFLERDKPVFPYTQFITFYQDLVPDTKRALMLGGGAYTIPNTLHKLNPEIIIDVVEIEPVLYSLAKKYFKLPTTDKINNYTEDARVFVNQTENTYDLIFIDVFSTGAFVPSHLITQEFFNSLDNILSTDGAIVLNFVGKPKTKAEKSIVGHFTKTVSSVFGSVETYIMSPDKPEQMQNIIYVLKKSPSQNSFADERVIKNYFSYPIEQTLSELQINSDQLYTKEDQILTDNKNPAEILTIKERILGY